MSLLDFFAATADLLVTLFLVVFFFFERRAIVDGFFELSPSPFAQSRTALGGLIAFRQVDPAASAAFLHD
jgi:predicted PurR-regulated permease PerM